MNDDLISRSELRKRFQAILDRGDMFCEYDIIGMADNAPTVEITDYDTGYQDGLEDGLNDIRPTGEWKYNGFCVTTPQYKCSVCGMHSLDRSKFCPNCGADMRKEADNEGN